MLLSCISLGCARAELDPVVRMIDRAQGYGFDTSRGSGSIVAGPLRGARLASEHSRVLYS
jgi:hypothetical protein